MPFRSIRIIADLALEQAPLQFLLRDIRGKDEERRNRALTCLCFLTTDCKYAPHACYDMKLTIQAQQLAKVQPVISEACTAIISCLCNLLPEAIEAETMLLNTNFAVRSEHFLNAIYFLKRILRSSFIELAKAGLITKWLSHYPFGGYMSKEGRKQRIKQLLSEEYEDIVMRSLVLIAESQPLSRSQLEDCGLLDKRDETLTNLPTDSMQMFDYPIEIIYESGTSDSRPSSVGGRRPREESLEEVALRRRRREAMVLGENGVPLVRANIIEPNSGAHQEGIIRSHL